MKNPDVFNPGPIFPSIDAEVLNEVMMSNPIYEMINADEQTTMK